MSLSNDRASVAHAHQKDAGYHQHSADQRQKDTDILRIHVISPFCPQNIVAASLIKAYIATLRYGSIKNWLISTKNKKNPPKIKAPTAGGAKHTPKSASACGFPGVRIGYKI